MIAPESVVPGKPIDEDGRLVAKKCEVVGQHCLIAAEHALGVDDAFRHPRRAGGKEYLGNGFRAHARVRGIDRFAGSRGEILELGDLQVTRTILADDDLDPGRDNCVQGTPELCTACCKDKAGSQKTKHVAQLTEIRGYQGIGRRDRRVRHTHVKCRQREQRMLDVVAGKNRHAAIH